MINSLLAVAATIGIYQALAYIQNKTQRVWLNPMLLSILMIIPILFLIPVSFEQYYQATMPLHSLLEPAIVILGYPLFLHIKSAKSTWKEITALLLLGCVLVVTTSFVSAYLLIVQHDIAVSLSLKSITTPIALALTSELNGDPSITAFSIILAGLCGALVGLPWLRMLGVHSLKAQGLAIGAASHVLGSATVSRVNMQLGAFGSLSLIISAVLTAVISPLLIPILMSLMN